MFIFVLGQFSSFSFVWMCFVNQPTMYCTCVPSILCWENKYVDGKCFTYIHLKLTQKQIHKNLSILPSEKSLYGIQTSTNFLMTKDSICESGGTINCYCWQTIRCNLSVKILQTAAWQQENKRTTNAKQIEVMELEGYSQLKCNKHCASSHDAV